MVKWMLVVALAGCGSNDMNGTSPDASGSGHADAAIDAPIEAPFGNRMPQITGGSGILAAPKVIAITYANDALRTDYETFFTQYAASTAWAAQAGEYGIGALTVAAPGRLAANAPTTLTENQFIANVLEPNITGASPAWGAADANTLYEISIPAGLAYDDGTGSKCCTDYLGYHYDTKIGNVDVPFAINCTCDGSGLTAAQNLTETANHETVEAATDPLGTGFAQTDDDHAAWTYTTDGEVADLCEYADTANLLMPAGMDYAIQRTWSNAAASAGHDPCVPVADADYYQTIPDAPDTGNVSIFGSHTSTHLTKIAKGATGTLTLHVYADGANPGPFKVTVDDWNGMFADPPVYLLSFVQPTGMFNAGDTVTVQVTVANTDSGLGNAAEAYQITTKPVTGPATYYYGLVGQ
ncbi:MAG: hypothetical protein ABI467_29255 [Kofleriaceae bacterium]